MKESPLLKRIMLDCGHGDVRLYRNNCGAFKDPKDPAGRRWVSYGVASPGGSDLIGWRSVVVTPDMVGQRVAVFAALEVKGEGGRATPEQRQFIENVRRAGGFAGVVRSIEEAQEVLHGTRTPDTVRATPEET